MAKVHGTKHHTTGSVFVSELINVNVQFKKGPHCSTLMNANKDKPGRFSVSVRTASWTAALGVVGGGGALRLVLFSEDSAEDPRLNPAI